MWISECQVESEAFHAQLDAHSVMHFRGSHFLTSLVPNMI